MLICCEAKQLRQRILEDQLREQVANAMEITESIRTLQIAAVKPMVIEVLKHTFALAVTPRDFAILADLNLPARICDLWPRMVDSRFERSPAPKSETTIRLHEVTVHLMHDSRIKGRCPKCGGACPL